MVCLEKIDSSLFPNLYESFLVDDDPLSDEQVWRNVFDYRWEHEEGHCGYALLDQGQVVGMIGMVFSEREIDGKPKKFCNLHTWWVREDHRGRSLSLLRPILRMPEYTITHFTPCDKVRALSKRLGFKTLDAQLKILLPIDVFRSARSADADALLFDEQAIEERLTEPDQRILHDHRPYGCGHLLVTDGSEDCYVVYTHVERHRLPYCHLHYISNMDVFARQQRLIRSAIIRRHRVKFAAIDARLVRDVKLPRSFDFWAPAHALYKSTDVRPEQIDNLYSDVVFLKLTVLPDISHELTTRVRRFLP